MDFNSFHTSDQQKEIIISGFLIKSPPSLEETKSFMSSFWDLGCGGISPSLIKKRWRRRFCVLYKVRSRDKTGIFFEYYKDRQCHKLKGHVDLKNCECITDDYQVGKWLNVFSIHTKHKGNSRVYYFSAPDPNSMSDWVRHLVEVKGFVNNAQPMEPPFPGYQSTLQGAQSTWGTYQRRGGLNQPLPSSAPLSATNRPKRIGSGTDGQQTVRGAADDGYREPPNPEDEYLLSAPEAELDGYYQLPVNHSYINLQGTEDQKKESPGGDDYNYLPPPLSSTDVQSPETADRQPSIPPRPLRQTAAMVNGNSKQPESNGGTDQPKRPGSSDSLYFNVWEASIVEDGVEQTPATTPSQSVPVPPPIANKPKVSSNVKPVRMFRQDERLSRSYQMPPVPTNPASNYVNESAPLPSRKPVPPPPPPRSPITATSTPSVLPADPLSNHPIIRAPSIESELALPVRASDTAGNNADSDSSSVQSITSDGEQLEKDDSLDNSLMDAPPGTAPPPPIEDDFSQTSRTPNQIETMGSKSQKTADMTSVQQSTRRIQQLNYIEPCNLELGTQPVNGGNPGRPVPPKRLQKPEQSGPQMNTVHGASVATGADPPSNSGDYYKIEYKEIDPIETNALAIATKCYLSDDALP